MAIHFGIPLEELKGRDRSYHLVNARKIISHLTLKNDYEVTLSMVGAYLRRDHATIIHYRNFVDGQLSIDKRFRRAYDEHKKYFDRNVLPKVNDINRSAAPKNELEKLKERIHELEASNNSMYYETMLFIEHINRHLQEDKLLEGFRRKKIDQKFLDVKQKLQQIKLA